MIYIVEGPDGTGKSTVVERLVKKNPTAKVIHSNLVPKNLNEFIRGLTDDMLIFSLSKTYGALIMDRSFIVSEYMYSHLYVNRKEYCTVYLVLEYIKMLSALETEFIITLYKDPWKTPLKTLDTTDAANTELLYSMSKLNTMYSSVFTAAKLKNISFEYIENKLQGEK